MSRDKCARGIGSHVQACQVSSHLTNRCDYHCLRLISSASLEESAATRSPIIITRGLWPLALLRFTTQPQLARSPLLQTRPANKCRGRRSALAVLGAPSLGDALEDASYTAA